MDAATRESRPSRKARRTHARLPLGLLMGGLLLACAPHAAPRAGPQPPPAPEGAVLMVGEHALFAPDVATLRGHIAELYPEYAPINVLRLALTIDALPRLALRSAEPDGWLAARQACAAANLEVTARRLEGNFRSLGLGLWSAARTLTPGEWSGPVELVGRYVRVRLERRVEADDPRLEVLHLSLLEFPVVDPATFAATLDAAVDASHLTLVDPLFDEAVPELWKHRMHTDR